MAEISAALVGLGVDGARIDTEIFGAAPSLTPGLAPEAARPPHPPAGEQGARRAPNLMATWHWTYDREFRMLTIF
jgi:hypothetical protein